MDPRVKRRRFALPVLTLLMVVAGGAGGSAQAQVGLTTLSAEDGGDWFDPSIWDGGAAPSADDVVIVENGATVALRADSPFLEGDVPSSWHHVFLGPGSLAADDTAWRFERLVLQGSPPAIGPAAAAFGGNLDIGRSVVVGTPHFGLEGATHPAGPDTLRVGGNLTGSAGRDADRGSGLTVGRGSIGQSDPPAGYSEGAIEVGGSVRGFSGVAVGTSFSERSFVLDPDFRNVGRLSVGGDLEVTLGIPQPSGPVLRDVAVGVSSAPVVAVDGTLEVGGDAILDYITVGSGTGRPATGTFEVAGNVVGAQTVMVVGQLVPAFDVRNDTPVSAPREVTGTVEIGGDLETLALYLGTTRYRSESHFDPADRVHAAVRVGGDLRSAPFTDDLYDTGYVSAGVGRGAGDYDTRLTVEGDTELTVDVLVAGLYRSAREDAGHATGILDLAGGSIRGTSSETSLLTIGKVDDRGSAKGRLDFSGSIEGFASTEIGVALADGHADGAVALNGGSLSTQRARIGVAESDDGSARGALRLAGARVDVSGEMELGTGSELSIVLDHEPDAERSAVIRTGTSVLDGVLEVVFGPKTGLGVYPLITAEAPGGLSGGFDRIDVVGIDPSRTRFEIDTVSVGERVVESFRVRVVPEPGTALLLGIGLAGLAASRRRPRIGHLPVR
ncbi:MAG: PEP-CTERM sorting domain-containing protein [bacterium]|nr:PEP-CTERM sorting domain-containing protein [bacterium]